jgi:hypothetical protein
VVNYPVPSAKDNCSTVAVDCSPASGSVFPKGTTTVVCTVTDGSGTQASCSFTVTVNDSEPPAIVCPADLAHEFEKRTGATVSFSPGVSDNCPNVSVMCVPASGSVFSIGTTLVQCTATDSSSNRSGGAFAVTVVGARGVKRDVLHELLALRSQTNSHQDREKLRHAIGDLNESLVLAFWQDETHVVPRRANRVFEEEQQAVHMLLELVEAKESGIDESLLTQATHRLVKADRLLAEVAIMETTAVGANPYGLNRCWQTLKEGDALAAHNKCQQAIEHYRQAWKQAQHARSESERQCWARVLAKDQRREADRGRSRETGRLQFDLTLSGNLVGGGGTTVRPYDYWWVPFSSRFGSSGFSKCIQTKGHTGHS